MSELVLDTNETGTAGPGCGLSCKWFRDEERDVKKERLQLKSKAHATSKRRNMPIEGAGKHTYEKLKT